MSKPRLLLILWVALYATVLRGQPATATPPDATEWRLIGRDPGQQHFSPLTQINDKNITELGLAWYADIPSKDGLVGVPLVAEGVIYQSGSGNIVYANDVRNGKLLWRFDPKIRFDGSIHTGYGGRTNRGLALADDKVVVSTADCRLVAVDRKRGEQLWTAPVCNPNDQYTITAAPRVGAGKIFVAPTNLDAGTRRGYVEAHDAGTGKRLWRFYFMPGNPADGFENKAMEMASKTWGKEYWRKVGGVSAWDSMTYDPVTNLLYVGVGGPDPWNPNERGEGRGDELFSNSIVALNADTGAYVWHYQVTPNDAWNYEPTMPIMVVDLRLQGRKRHVVLEAPKNGFFYVLDAKTGKLLSAKNFVPVNWASRIDMTTGRPVELPEAKWYEHASATKVRPTPNGAHDWRPMSYSPLTGLVYLPACDAYATLQVSNARAFFGGNIELSMEPEMGGGLVIAWDPIRQERRWSQPLKKQLNGGVLSTAGNLVFQGTATGELRAYRADTGAKVWSMYTTSPVVGTPITVEVAGQQTVFAYTGDHGRNQLIDSDEVAGPVRLLAFQLGATGKLPDVVPKPPFPKPPLPQPAADLVNRGRVLFDEKGCDLCHGDDATQVGLPGSVPDLRRASAQTHEQFAAIVIGGLRQDKGMPIFADSVTPDELAALQAFILHQAWAAYSAQTPALQAIH